MAKYAFLVMVNAAEGQDDVLNNWLDTVHLPEVLQTEGFRAVTRYALPPEDVATSKAHRYMHIYEIETDDIAKTKAAMGAANATRSPMSPALDLTSISAVFYKAL